MYILWAYHDRFFFVLFIFYDSWPRMRSPIYLIASTEFSCFTPVTFVALNRSLSACPLPYSIPIGTSLRMHKLGQPTILTPVTSHHSSTSGTVDRSMVYSPTRNMYKVAFLNLFCACLLVSSYSWISKLQLLWMLWLKPLFISETIECVLKRYPTKQPHKDRSSLPMVFVSTFFLRISHEYGVC